MLKEVLTTLRWSVSLGAKFFRVVPYYTTSIVLITLIAQLSALLSSFLPLKVIILLGSEGMPRYFPQSFQSVDRDLLVVLLSIATVGFFLLTLLANKLIDLATASASEKLLSKSHKLSLFENQDQVAANGYQKYSSALAGLVFILLALSGIGYFYPSMSFVLIIYPVCAFSLVIILSQYVSSFHDYLEVNLSSFVSLISNIGFFVAFSYLVVEFVLWTPPGFIFAIVSLLLSRQIFTRITGFVSGVFGLSKQRQKLDALFFHGKQLIPSSVLSKQNNIWSYLSPEVREGWLLPLLSDVERSPSSADRMNVKWLESGQQDIPHLLVSIDGDERKFLIKLYEKNRTAMAKHEASLLLDPPSGLPAPALVYVTEIEKLACHVFVLPSGELLTKKANRQGAIDVGYSLALTFPSAGLKNRYLRSKPLVGDRLTPSLLERVKVAVNDERHLLTVDNFIEALPDLKHILDKLPLVIVNPAIQSGVWKEKASDAHLAINWEKWALEPLGAGVPPGQINKFLNYVESEGGNVHKNLDPASVKLAALALELERLINKQKLSLAFGKVKSMLRLLNEKVKGGN